MTTVLLLLLALLVLALVIAAKNWGRAKEQRKTAEASARKSDVMLEAEANAPRTQQEVVDRMDKGRY